LRVEGLGRADLHPINSTRHVAGKLIAEALRVDHRRTLEAEVLQGGQGTGAKSRVADDGELLRASGHSGLDLGGHVRGAWSDGGELYREPGRMEEWRSARLDRSDR